MKKLNGVKKDFSRLKIYLTLQQENAGGVKKDFSRLNVYLTLFSFVGISGTQKTTSKTVPPDGLSLMLILPSCAFTIS